MWSIPLAGSTAMAHTPRALSAFGFQAVIVESHAAAGSVAGSTAAPKAPAAIPFSVVNDPARYTRPRSGEYVTPSTAPLAFGFQALSSWPAVAGSSEKAASRVRAEPAAVLNWPPAYSRV